MIHHLSHELKTPVSVLAASLNLLNKKISVLTDDLQADDFQRILERARRNLNRILEMQYKIEDILREKDYKTYYMLSALLDVCTEELEIFTESYETQFFCTANPAGWDPIYGKSPVHFAGEIHSAALRRALR